VSTRTLRTHPTFVRRGHVATCDQIDDFRESKSIDPADEAKILVAYRAAALRRPLLATRKAWPHTSIRILAWQYRARMNAIGIKTISRNYWNLPLLIFKANFRNLEFPRRFVTTKLSEGQKRMGSKKIADVLLRGSGVSNLTNL